MRGISSEVPEVMRGGRGGDPGRGHRADPPADPGRHRRLAAERDGAARRPNIFTGGHEYHSVREWASVQDMAAAAAVVVRLAEVWSARDGQ